MTHAVADVTARAGLRRGRGAWLALPVALLVTALIGATACGGPGDRPQALPQVQATPDAVPSPSPAPDPGSPAPPPPAGLAAAAVAAGDAAAGDDPESSVGVAVHDGLTGETAVGANGAVPMYSASLVKLIVTIDVLERGTGTPASPRDVTLIRRMLGPSDDEAMNALWSEHDGIGAVSRVSSRIGLTETRAPQDPSQWGETVLSARDMVRLYEYVLQSMRPADRDLIMSSLAAAPAEATDGFDQEFGLLTGDRVAAKQGWLCCVDGRIYLHSTGVADPGQRFAVAILAHSPSGAGYARDTVTEVTDAVRAPLR